MVPFEVVALMCNLGLLLYCSWCSTSGTVMRPGPEVLLWQVVDYPPPPPSPVVVYVSIKVLEVTRGG